MPRLEETEISRAILSSYHQRLTNRLVNDVLIVGAGPAGLTAAYYLARKGLKTTIVEKRLSPGGGIWGGGMAMSEAVIQDDAIPVLEEVGVRYKHRDAGLHTVNAIELAAGLCLKAIQAGAELFNLTTVEDVCVHQSRVDGLVINRTMIVDALPVDPITLAARAVIDATGHEAIVVDTLRRRQLLPPSAATEHFGEGPMDATGGEAFVVDHVREIYPGLWLTGMSVCAAMGGPRMGPIFGGMLMSGKRVAERIADALA